MRNKAITCQIKSALQ